ncbi:ubiquitin-like domain-containing CTD phosphatase 1 [Neodiprion virginianus]|uniref:ubiquitin-like domain-containing CTD phosphatase 1 n=1 Tax=Neodiprion fabricii TaxID=2872261 RepID=UPI001ED8F514|nr:ubiquitin-like domain-containing CTD phosphatase 1 [Neodiprion fabricii]XP_046615503.1 ubiquitin-like domain-containing CTD phosphatase 1 [Neodiprion virginianus]
MMANEVRMIVKWCGKEYEICNITENDTVSTLKDIVHKETGVRPERQKLLNLRFKGKAAQDEDTIGKLSIKPGFKLMLMGSREEDIAEASQAPENVPDVVNDLDIAEEEVIIEKAEVYLAKINRRIQDYQVIELNPLREGMKLLVLDIDYTLFDHKSLAESGHLLMRPYLHEFLTMAYKDYDIVIWSATSMKWINEKMRMLGVSSHPNYKIAFHLDSLAMITVHTPKYSVVDVKPLGVIWGKYKQFSAKNTIMFDDIRRNFLMNPQSGLRIRPYKQAHFNRDKDRELLKLAKYLKLIAKVDDFQTLNHRKWEEYVSKKKRSERRTEGDEQKL